MFHNKPYTNPQSVFQTLYAAVKDLPLICPHGHVNPALFADKDYRFRSPVDLLIIPDHYIFRMLYSHGIPLETLGIPTRTGQTVEEDHRKIWQTVADHWHLFHGTPTSLWIREELRTVLGIEEKLRGVSANAIYDAIQTQLDQPEFTPRHLFKQFNIEVLATTDVATDTLAHHQAVLNSAWDGRIIPTFRPDALFNIQSEQWNTQIKQLSEVSGVTVHHYHSFLQALQQRRAFFKEMGAVATDHGAQTAYTTTLDADEAERLFRRALAGVATREDAEQFTAHMLVVMAEMSAEDGLVMQLHIGSYRNHNPTIFAQFGRDMGADIPVTSEFTINLKPLLDRFGNHPNFACILFTLDESTYSRELAPLAGHYPAVKLGPPWWFYDSPNGMRRYFDRVMETAGLYNTAGFNDDTRAFLSIPARHQVWRQAACGWLATMVEDGRIDEEDAHEMAYELAYGLAKRAYRLEG